MSPFEQYGYQFIADASSLISEGLKARSVLEALTRPLPSVFSTYIDQASAALLKLSGQLDTTSLKLDVLSNRLVGNQKIAAMLGEAHLNLSRDLENEEALLTAAQNAAHGKFSKGVIQHAKAIDLLVTKIGSNERAQQTLRANTALLSARRAELTLIERNLKDAIDEVTAAEHKAAATSLLWSGVMGAASLGIAAAFAKMTLDAIRFGETVAGISTIISSAALPTLITLESDILRISAAYGFTATDVTNALKKIMLAHIPAADATYILEQSAIAARASFTDLSIMADMTSSILVAYSMQASEAGKVTDMLFESMRQGKVDAVSLNDQLGRIIGSAAEAGVAVEELLAIMSLASRMEMDAGVVMTSLGGMIRNFLKPTTQAETLALEKFGVEMNATTLATHGLIGAMKLFKGASLDDLGVIFSQIRAQRLWLPLMSRIGEAEKLITKLQDSHGASLDALNRIQDKTFYQVDRLGASFKALRVTIGEMVDGAGLLKDAFRGLADVMSSLSEAIGDPGKHPLLRLAIGLGAATVALTLAIGSLKIALALIAPLLIKAFGAATLVAIVSGLAEVAVVVGLVVASLYALYRIYQLLHDPTKQFYEDQERLASAMEKGVLSEKDLARQQVLLLMLQADRARRALEEAKMRMKPENRQLWQSEEKVREEIAVLEVEAEAAQVRANAALEDFLNTFCKVADEAGKVVDNIAKEAHLFEVAGLAASKAWKNRTVLTEAEMGAVEKVSALEIGLMENGKTLADLRAKAGYSDAKMISQRISLEIDYRREEQRILELQQDLLAAGIDRTQVLQSYLVWYRLVFQEAKKHLAVEQRVANIKMATKSQLDYENAISSVKEKAADYSLILAKMTGQYAEDDLSKMEARVKLEKDMFDLVQRKRELEGERAAIQEELDAEARKMTAQEKASALLRIGAIDAELGALPLLMKARKTIGDWTDKQMKNYEMLAMSTAEMGRWLSGVGITAPIIEMGPMNDTAENTKECASVLHDIEKQLRVGVLRTESTGYK